MKLFPQSPFFGWVVGINHSLGQSSQFLSAELTLASKLNGELDDARLFVGRKLLNFFDAGCGSHRKKWLADWTDDKGKSLVWRWRTFHGNWRASLARNRLFLLWE